MNGRLYTGSELEYLKNNWQNKTIKEMALELNRKPDALGRKLSYLGFTRDITSNEYVICKDYAELRVTNDKIKITTKVDLNQVNKLKKYTWNLSNNGYLCARIKNKITILHRYILEEANPNIYFDHINQDKLDNRICNLRKCTKAENNQNKFDKNKSSTGKRGVVLNKNGKMIAQVKINGVQIFLKSGGSLEELDTIAKFARAYIHPFSEEASKINKEDIPQWIKDKIDRRLKNAR